MTNLVYKLIDKDLWSDFEANRRFDGAPVDHADGFIHLSDGGQVEETARRHFAEQDDLMILALDADRLGPCFRISIVRYLLTILSGPSRCRWGRMAHMIFRGYWDDLFALSAFASAAACF